MMQKALANAIDDVLVEGNVSFFSFVERVT